jgi:DNA methylase
MQRTERAIPHRSIHRRMRTGGSERLAAPYNIQKLENGAIHRWYRFVLAYPDHFVRSQLQSFRVRPRDLVLDPFVGSGTTCVESKFRGFPSIGIDAHPFFVFATGVKTTWDVDLETLRDARASVLGELKNSIVGRTALDIAPEELRTLTDIYPYEGLLTRKYVSPLPLAKCIELRSIVDEVDDAKIRDLFKLALATTFVSSANVDFGPEIGLTKPKRDSPVLENFASRTAEMIEDLEKVAGTEAPTSDVWIGDSRTMEGVEADSVAAIVTSPPYPVDKDYTRQIRLESAILGFVTNLAESRRVKERMVRASTRQIYAVDNDTDLVRSTPEVMRIINEIVRRARADGDTSGFVKQYPRLVGEYFGGMKRHMESAYRCLRRGGRAAYVVGDSRSFKMVHIETAKILAKIAADVGFRVDGIELWRDRRSTAHEKTLPENVLLLRRP